jgi:hypothetical protein
MNLQEINGSVDEALIRNRRAENAMLCMAAGIFAIGPWLLLLGIGSATHTSLRGALSRKLSSLCRYVLSGKCTEITCYCKHSRSWLRILAPRYRQRDGQVVYVPPRQMMITAPLTPIESVLIETLTFLEQEIGPEIGVQGNQISEEVSKEPSLESLIDATLRAEKSNPIVGFLTTYRR